MTEHAKRSLGWRR